MKRGLGSQGGYTIIEVIIFLAVSSALMASAVYLFQGRIPRTQFVNSVNELDSKLRDTMNEVVNGYYPSDGNVSCNGAAAQEQGRNEDCLFLGRTVQFGPGIGGCSISSPGEECDKIALYTISGTRLQVSGDPAESLKEAQPQLISSGSAAPLTASIGYGTYITKAFYNSGVGRIPVSGVSFVQSFGTGTNADKSLKGAQQVSLVAMQGTLGENMVAGDPAGFISKAAGVSGTIANGTNSVGEGVFVCLAGGKNQYAIIGIGGDNRSVATNVQILDKADWVVKGC